MVGLKKERALREMMVRLRVREEDIEEKFIRSQGPGGQNVNKVSSAIHLRFDINASSLSDFYKQRLLNLRDQRISKEGVIVIKAQKFRTQEKNREDALERLQKLIKGVAVIRKVRQPTKATRGSQERRLDSKARRGNTKALRGRVSE